ncbi:MAG TPA: hypothetical protein VEY96_05015 [Actinomycetes bacterium]|nr:hypothetical protein [Actinomycetes bacterium]
MAARWHDGRLWLSNWGTQQILAVGLDGNAEVMATDWRMQDGFEDNIKRLTTGPETGQVLAARAPAAHAGHP